MRTRAFLVGGLLVALLAAAASVYGSASPDGLEYVAEKAGFLDSAQESAASDGPFAGYRTRGIDGARLSGATAGVLGTLVVLLLAGGLAWGVRRRGSPAGSAEESPAEESPAEESPDDEHAESRR